MSFTFTVELGDPTRLIWEALLTARDPGGIACQEDDALTGTVQPDRYHHLFEPGRSTRCVEVRLDGAAFSVRILTGSCADTHELALDLIERAAGIAGGGAIESENGVVLGPDDRGPTGRYNRAWSDKTAADLATFLLRMAEQEPDDVFTLSGPHRPFYLGKRALAAVHAAGGPPGAALLAHLRRAQYASDVPGVFAASILAVTDPSGARAELAVWGPGSSYLLPRVDAVAIIAEPRITVPIAVVPTIAGDRATFLDDHHLLIAAVPEAEWPAIVERARPHGVELSAL